MQLNTHTHTHVWWDEWILLNQHGVNPMKKTKRNKINENNYGHTYNRIERNIKITLFV